MTRDAVFSFGNKIDATARIAKFLAHLLDVPWLTGTETGGRAFDKLIVVAGGAPFAGKDVLDSLGVSVALSRRVIWATNDYGISIPKVTSLGESPYRACARIRVECLRPSIDVWSTVRAPGRRYVNWNALTFSPRSSSSRTPSSDRMIYYGYFREQRAIYFDRYFACPKIPITLSYPQRGKSVGRMRKYDHELITHQDKISGDLYLQLAGYGLGLYLEDAASHSEYHSPANRFYEMLSAGLPIVAQPEAAWTLAEAGYLGTSMLVLSPSDLRVMMKMREDHAEYQRINWFPIAESEHRQLPVVVRSLWKELE